MANPRGKPPWQTPVTSVVNRGLKNILTHIGDTVRDDNVLQARTPMKSHIPDAGHTIRDRYSFQ